jgi:hypothetical protein
MLPDSGISQIFDPLRDFRASRFSSACGGGAGIVQGSQPRGFPLPVALSTSSLVTAVLWVIEGRASGPPYYSGSYPHVFDSGGKIKF